MTAKDFLMQAHGINSVIASKNAQIKDLNDIATNCSQTLTGMPHAQRKTQSTMSDAVIKIVALEEELSKDIIALVDTKKRIGNVIAQVRDSELRTLLEYRYLCTGRTRTWENIANTMGYEIRYIQKLHGKALYEVQNVIDREKQ